MRAKLPPLALACCLGLVAACASPAEAAQYRAFSLNAARERIEGAGEAWRDREPEVVSLGGINQVQGFVYDAEHSDLILVGEHDEGRPPLALDDLVVALRAWFRYDEWPLVGIDPPPETSHAQMQQVRFEGGIHETAFGQAMFDADYRLKRMALGLEPPGPADLKTYWERSVEEADSGALTGTRETTSRFWLCTINPHVVVREGVCVVRGLKVAVFAEVLDAKINGKDVEEGFKDAAADAFAGDAGARFEDLCRTEPSLNRLRGLQELVAVSTALGKLDEQPDLGWWLESYALESAQTPKETEVLRRRHDGQGGWVEVSGGVQLTALAMRLNAGDVTALRRAVLAARPSADALAWSFTATDWAIPLGEGQVGPESVSPLFQQGAFLQEQERYRDALGIYEQALEVTQHMAEARFNKGAALEKLDRIEEALACYEKALEIDPHLAEAWYRKGVVLGNLRRHDEALKCFERVLEINRHHAKGWSNKGASLIGLGRPDEALKCLDRAVELNPRYGEAWSNKAATLGRLGRYDEALECCERALEINPRLTKAWANKATALGCLGRYGEQLECYDRALEINPRYANAWYNKGVALSNLGRYDEARRAFEEAARLEAPRPRRS